VVALVAALGGALPGRIQVHEVGGTGRRDARLRVAGEGRGAPAQQRVRAQDLRPHLLGPHAAAPVVGRLVEARAAEPRRVLDAAREQVEQAGRVRRGVELGPHPVEVTAVAELPRPDRRIAVRERVGRGEHVVPDRDERVERVADHVRVREPARRRGEGDRRRSRERLVERLEAPPAHGAQDRLGQAPLAPLVRDRVREPRRHQRGQPYERARAEIGALRRAARW
jgi:hypothetical protein